MSGGAVLEADERHTSADPMWSYAQREYVPPAAPAGRLRSSSLFHSTLLRHGEGDLASVHVVERLVGRARQEFGLERTVWSIKLTDDLVGWELYWYDHSDEEPLTLERVRAVFEPEFSWPALAPGFDGRQWSISVDLGFDDLRDQTVRGVHLYVTRQSEPPTCASYRLRAEGLQLENVYYLFGGSDPREPVEWLRSSYHGVSGDRLLDASLFPCDHVALAHKPAADGVYLGGLPVRAAANSLRRGGAPGWAVSLLDRSDGDLDHLLVDVGFDLRRGPSGRSTVVKRAIHGVV